MQLEAVGSPVPENELVLKLLEAVHPSYGMFITAIEAQGGNPTFVEVTTRLMHEELRRHQDERTKESAYMGRHNGGKGHNSGNNKRNIKCYHCGKMGHMKKECFKWKKEHKPVESVRI